MTDTTQAKPAEGQTQQPAMPTGKQQVPETVPAQEAAPVKEEATVAKTGSELPEGVKERTKEQFDKLQAEKESLKTKLEIAESLARPKVPEKEPRKLYDPLTGLVDTNQLNQLGTKVESLEKENQRLKQVGQDKEAVELFIAHPELDSKNKEKFNQELFDEADKIWMHSQVHPDKYGGRALTQRQAADLAKEKTPVAPDAEKEARTAKEQASLSTPGRPGQGVKDTGVSAERSEQLRDRTRRGDKQSMIERMKAIPAV